MVPAKSTASAALPATLGAFAMIAQQVVTKASRDALFLTHFQAERLPYAMTSAALLSGVSITAAAALVGRLGPARFVPIAFVTNAVLLLVDWGVSLRSELLTSLLVYAQQALFGATLVSGFWSLTSEAFEPHEAKRQIARVGAGAAMGGLVGGFTASVLATKLPVSAMLVLAAGLNVVCAASASVVGARTKDVTASASAQPSGSGLRALKETPYLRGLAVVVLLGAMTQALLDYALGVEATRRYGGGSELFAFFALFQTATGLAAFLVQIAASEAMLERAGLGWSLTSVPLAVIGFGGFALAVPSLVAATAQRAAESVMRASVFRSAYEVLFTPLPPSVKRPTKALVDVGFDRVGTFLGGALTLGVVVVFPDHRARVATAAAMIASVLCVLAGLRLRDGYVAVLAQRLRAGVVRLDVTASLDATTRATVSQTLQSVDRETLLAQIEAHRRESKTAPSRGEGALASTFGDAPFVPAQDDDPVVLAVSELRAEGPDTIRAALDRHADRVPLLAPLVIDLLAREDVAEAAVTALTPHASHLVGQLTDALVDAKRPAGARMRVAAMLGRVPDARAVDGLLGAMSVSAPSSLRRSLVAALESIFERDPALKPDRARFIDAAQALVVGAPRGAQVDAALELVGFVFPREAIELARDGLRSEDGYLRSVAREYLDTVLPPSLRDAMGPLFAAQPRVAARRDPRRASGEALDELLRSRDEIRLSVREARGPDAS